MLGKNVAILDILDFSENFYYSILLWVKIARPHRKPFGLLYTLETCFSSTSGSNLFFKKIIKKSLEKSEKLQFFYFLVTRNVSHSLALIGQQ